jgi:prepilin-type N-terminal cleavage/methylation domain-containing protein
MLSPAGKSSQAGFTLVEILVVTVIMGLTLISIYGTYLSTQKSSVTS